MPIIASYTSHIPESQDWAENHVADDNLNTLTTALDTIGHEDGSEHLDSLVTKTAADGSAAYTRLHAVPVEDGPALPDDPDGDYWRLQAVGPTFRDLYQHHVGGHPGASVIVGSHRGMARLRPCKDLAEAEAAKAEEAEESEGEDDDVADVAEENTIVYEPASRRSKRRRT